MNLTFNYFPSIFHCVTKVTYFLWKLSFKKLHNPSSKCDNPNDICTYWIENEHHCLIKFDTRNVPEICRRQNNWNQCPTWPRSHQDLSPEKFPPFLSILSQKKRTRKGKHNWAKNFMKFDLNSIICKFKKALVLFCFVLFL